MLTAAINQDVWSLRNLGFAADPISTAVHQRGADRSARGLRRGVQHRRLAVDAPQPTARARLTAFFARGGGYIGAGTNGANFLDTGGQVTGLTAASRSGNGRSGIVYWNNTAGAASPVTGAYPEQDTAIMDPPTWFTSVPATMSVDGAPAVRELLRLRPVVTGRRSRRRAPGSAVIAHGTNTAGTSRMTVFAMNPLYRADPEREWPMLSSAAYWADQ